MWARRAGRGVRSLLVVRTLVHVPTQLRTFAITFNRAAARPVGVVGAKRYLAAGASGKIHEFKAETKSLLDIVARSLYSESEIFVRELISNAADAIEKLRFKQSTDNDVSDPDRPLTISIDVDEKNQTFSIQDTGIGMTEEELVSYLGTIAKSGSKEFVADQSKQAGTSAQAAANIIGQFGVGFYSSFMVGSTVTVFSKSSTPGSKSYIWESDGVGAYTISESPAELPRGTKIVIKLKDDHKKYASKDIISGIVKKYSNFINAPIHLNGAVENTVKPLWTVPANQITEKEHSEFYQFIAKAWDEPKYTIQMSADAPISVRALLYIPTIQREKFGLEQTESGVSLYCRKVLIKSNMRGLLPSWLRFVRGVVDSEDIPLNLSRELLQDSSLIAKLKTLLTNKVIKYLDDQAKADPKKYEEFYKDHSRFLREGIYTDRTFAKQLLGLMRYESTGLDAGITTSFNDYIARMPATQKNIYYLCSSSRDAAQASPYLEALKANNVEVLLMYDTFDPVILDSNTEFGGKNLVSIESSDVTEFNKSDDKDSLSDKDEKEMHAWFKNVLGEKISAVSSSRRLISYPAMVVDHEASSVRRLRKTWNPELFSHIPAQKFEINPAHPLIVQLNAVRKSNADTAKAVTQQIFDNALMVAGLFDEPGSMVPRLNTLLQLALSAPASASQAAHQSEPESNTAPAEQTQEKK
eukprot:m.465976 g.465976  ORF g.465976 m.465976 type:complete len:696 (-) comp57057_c0_seq1:99-2186(-)